MSNLALRATATELAISLEMARIVEFFNSLGYKHVLSHDSIVAEVLYHWWQLSKPQRREEFSDATTEHKLSERPHHCVEPVR